MKVTNVDALIALWNMIELLKHETTNGIHLLIVELAVKVFIELGNRC